MATGKGELTWALSEVSQTLKYWVTSPWLHTDSRYLTSIIFTVTCSWCGVGSVQEIQNNTLRNYLFQGSSLLGKVGSLRWLQHHPTPHSYLWCLWEAVAWTDSKSADRASVLSLAAFCSVRMTKVKPCPPPSMAFPGHCCCSIMLLSYPLSPWTSLLK